MDSKKWYRSRLLWLGVSEIVAGAGKFAAEGDPTALVTALGGILTVVLRLVTKTPLTR